MYKRQIFIRLPNRTESNRNFFCPNWNALVHAACMDWMADEIFTYFLVSIGDGVGCACAYGLFTLRRTKNNFNKINKKRSFLICSSLSVLLHSPYLLVIWQDLLNRRFRYCSFLLTVTNCILHGHRVFLSLAGFYGHAGSSSNPALIVAMPPQFNSTQLNIELRTQVSDTSKSAS